MANMTQRAFAAGEVSPALYRRSDLVKYATGLRTLRNMRVMRHGGVQNDPGSEWIAEVKDSTKTTRLIPFRYNDAQTYMLEFGDEYMRVIKDGVVQTRTAQNISGVSAANPAVVTYAGADNYANGDHVYISGIAGGLGQYLNGRTFIVSNVVAGSNTFELTYLNGTNVNSSSWPAWSSGGTVAEIYQITTPYDHLDLPRLKFAQSGDVLTLTHPTYSPRNLSRTGDIVWSLDEITSLPQATPPTNLTGTEGASGSNTYRYMVTRIDPVTGEESLPAGVSLLGATIDTVSQQHPIVVTTTGAHGFADDDYVFIKYDSMPAIHQRIFRVNVTGAGTFELIGEDGTTYTDANGSGSCNLRSVTLTTAAAPTTSAPHIIEWTDENGPANATTEYNVYKESGGIFGLIGVTKGGSFSDVGITPDTTIQPPLVRPPFLGAGNYPSTVAYIQQRRTLANTTNNPEQVAMSQTGYYTNFHVNSPVRDSDAVIFTMAGARVNPVRHILDAGRMVVMTSEAEFSIGGNESGIILPGQINPKQHSNHGASEVQPILAGDSVLFIQEQGSIVRDLAFQFSSDGYTGNDLTTFSAHLVDGYELTYMDYQKTPHPIVWFVRDDGVLLSLTYVKEQQILGWAKHDTDGLYKCVSCITEGSETSVYVIVQRTIDGRTVQYIERFASRDYSDVIDAVFAHSALSYDGRHTGSTTMTLSGGSTWLYGEELTLTASASTFASTDVGNEIWLYEASGTPLRLSITSYTSATVVKVQANRTVPVALRSVAWTDWAEAVDTLQGLWHLEGETVAVVADRFVLGSPNNDAYPTYTVDDGEITLEEPHAVIHVGLPYLSDLETLDIDTSQGESLIGKKKRVSRVTVSCVESRGIWAGPKPPTDDDDDPLENLTEKKIRDEEGYDDPVALLTGDAEVIIRPNWNSNGRVFVRQVDPLPLTITAITGDADVPYGRG